MATILVIEDDTLTRELYRRVLEKRGHRVLATDKGVEGLELTWHEKVDLVLLDLSLPDLDGVLIAGLIKRVTGTIPVVAVTGRSDESARQRALSQGCSGYITKPIDVHTFGQQVETYIPNKA